MFRETLGCPGVPARRPSILVTSTLQVVYKGGAKLCFANRRKLSPGCQPVKEGELKQKEKELFPGMPQTCLLCRNSLFFPPPKLLGTEAKRKVEQGGLTFPRPKLASHLEKADWAGATGQEPQLEAQPTWLCPVCHKQCGRKPGRL